MIRATRQVDGSGLAFLYYNPPLEPGRRCHLCLHRARLTKEHVPPESAFNGSRRMWERFNPHTKGIDTETGELRGPAQTVLDTWQGGFYVRTLCGECNSRTGHASARAYVEFARHLAEAPRLFEPCAGQRTVRVRPDTLLIARQIAVMIVAIENVEFARKHNAFRLFARGEIATVVPPFRVFGFLVPDHPKAGTIVRSHGRMETAGQGFNAMGGEISMFPFGFVYANEIGPGYRAEDLADVTHWFSDASIPARENAWVSLPQRLTVLDSMHVALGNPRRGPQIDTVPNKR
jgi:hypothetical protein